uniref:Uncharacterized protein n=1 Tax=Rhizophora mucronata TaxID=61149 RepID=A0A2P2P716_RHIMU
MQNKRLGIWDGSVEVFAGVATILTNFRLSVA